MAEPSPVPTRLWEKGMSAPIEVAALTATFAIALIRAGRRGRFYLGDRRAA